MATEYINPQWRLPSMKEGNNQSYSMDFNGNNQYVAIGTGLGNTLGNGLADMTISIWINITPSLSSYNDGIFKIGALGSNVGKFAIRVPTDARIQAYFGASSVSKQYDLLAAGNWNHIVIVKEGTTVSGYINEVLTTPASSGGSIPSTLDFSGEPAFIGAYWNGSFPFDGKMHGVAVFDYALSQNQVTTLYNVGTPFNPMALPSPPINYYPLGNSAHMGSDYLTPNGALQDYVFDINGNSSKYFNFSKTSVGSDDFTFSFWVIPEPYAAGGGDAGDTLLGNTNGTPGANQWNMWIYEPTGRLNLVWYNQTSSAGNFMTTNFSFGAGTVNQEWTHVALTRVGTTVTFYFNGVADTATPGTLSSSSITLDDSSNATMRLPSPWGGTVYNQDGFYSNLLWHNVGLSSTEIQTLYNYGSPIQTLANIPQSSNLKAWYKLDASEIYDSSNTQWQIANNVLSDKAYSFNGTNNIEITQNSSIQTSNFSIGLWIKGYPQSGKTIIENGGTNGFTIKTDLTDTAAVRIITGGTNGLKITGALNGEWNFVWFTWNGGNSRGGLNGGYNYSGGSATNYDSSKGLFIGSDSSSSNGFVGEIAQVVYYDGRGDNYATGTYGTVPTNPPASTSSTANLVSWWKLDAASITDSQGSNNGTNNGATLIDTNVGRPAGIGGLSSGMNQTNLVQSDLLTTSSYSPYSINFTGNSFIEVNSTPILNGATSLSISAWCKIDNNVEEPICSLWVSGSLQYLLRSNTSYGIQFYLQGSWGMQSEGTNQALTPGQWYHVVATWDGSFIYIYVNGSLAITPQAASGTLNTITGQKDWIGRYGANYLDGNLSNVAYWKDTALSGSQVKEIYNEGRPSNLHTFSGTAPTAWWQLGSNSSFASNWTFLDEVGSNDVTSTSMLENAIADGVGTSGNGVSTNMSTPNNILGDSPNGEANSLSINMTVANLAGGVN